MLVRDSENKGRSLWESVQALIDGEIRFSSTDRSLKAGLTEFVRNIMAMQRKLASSEIPLVSELIDHIRTTFKYDDHLRKKFGPEADERIKNLEELKIFAVEVYRMTEDSNLPDLEIVGAEDEEETALARFLGNITLMTDVRDGDEEGDCVRPV